MSDFLRNCWNERTPPEIFYQQLIKFPEDKQDIIIESLFEICAKLEPTNNFLLSYLITIFKENLYYIINKTDSKNHDHILSLVYIIISAGDALFTNLPVMDVKSAKAILKILEICISVDDKELLAKAITKLSLAHSYSVIVAASRITAKDEFDVMKEMITTKIGEPTNLKNHSLEMLKNAIFSSGPIQSPNYKITKVYFKAFVSNLRIWMPSIRLLHFCGMSYIVGIYCSLLKSYLANPSLIDGFLLTTIFAHLFQVIDDEEFPDHLDSSGPISKEDIIFMFDKLDQYNMFDELGIEMPKLEDRFSFIPDAIETSNIILTALTYPLTCVMIPDLILERLDGADIVTAQIICHQIEDNLTDFIYLVDRMGRTVTFCISISNMMIQTSDETIFYSLFTLFVSVIKFLWRTGSQQIRNTFKAYVDQFDPCITNFLKDLLLLETFQTPPPTDISSVQTSATPINRVLMFHEYLYSFQPTDIELITPLLERNPYLFIPLFIWARRVRTPYLHDFMKSKFPQQKIFSFLFHQAYTMLEKPVGCPLYEEPDFDTIMEMIPTTIDIFLNMMIMYFFSRGQRSTMFADLESIVISWRVCIRKFGTPSFVEALSRRILRTPIMLTAVDPTIVSMPIAYMVSIACDEDSTLLLDVLKNIVGVIDRVEVIPQAEGIAQMCIILLLSVYAGWEERADFLIDYIKGTMTDSLPPISPYYIFALTILKTLIYMQDMRQRIPIDFYKIFIDHREWELAIDFFVLKSGDLENQ